MVFKVGENPARTGISSGAMIIAFIVSAMIYLLVGESPQPRTPPFYLL